MDGPTLTLKERDLECPKDEVTIDTNLSKGNLDCWVPPNEEEKDGFEPRGQADSLENQLYSPCLTASQHCSPHWAENLMCSRVSLAIKSSRLVLPSS